MDSPALTTALDELLHRLVPGQRLILGIAGAPGSGKSTVAQALQRELEAAVVVPMDGFHLGNAIIDGTPLRDRKGAPDTFDVGGYVSLLARLVRRDEEVVYAPAFRRSLDEPVAASIAVPQSAPVVITEGNYLLSTLPGWREIRQHLDEVWFLDLAGETRISRLVERHMHFGMDRDAAVAWANGPDQANAELIAATRDSADRLLRVG
ncbi:nucleoside/nucleotide kinase family protein [Pseudarthrobacter sp. PS3-L1]|uniref:nucleoside/nucleotide kinase family protein n=1 Tax=Pseudarthrobacter sp. PS3-L1 TaxID=3046207 RepID=UPI0024B89EB0|nr:nucleoside/nucleotide kinase family protein [Pseudarthrobacter sp. PS3-L1]MDJ0319115.1 nucleoside/nucleotide kinase family protein [Pseudarthrobacter sp. PS3-L1]